MARKPTPSEGYTAKSYRGISVAVEHNSDGSVTICKEVVDEIQGSPRVPTWVKDILRTAPDESSTTLRAKISAIFVKWGLPTRQVVINEIIKAIEDRGADATKGDMPSGDIGKRLDDIYIATVFTKNGPPGVVFTINLANDSVYQRLKQQIMQLIEDTCIQARIDELRNLPLERTPQHQIGFITEARIKLRINDLARKLGKTKENV